MRPANNLMATGAVTATEKAQGVLAGMLPRVQLYHPSEVPWGATGRPKVMGRRHYGTYRQGRLLALQVREGAGDVELVHRDEVTSRSSDMRPKIVAYTYEADIQCPDCALLDALVGRLERRPPLGTHTDQHGLTTDLVDREGNPVRPVFSTDECESRHCGECNAEL